MTQEFDPIQIEVMWNRLLSLVDEQASALIRASFTTIVRETEDLSAGLFTRGADLIVQARTGTPGHINTMATAVKHFAKKFPPESMKPGDVLICNNPWICSGHRHDFTVVTPIFNRDNMVAWSASCCHSIDIGGLGFTADAKDVYEEGLGLPIMKLVKEGVMNAELVDIIKENVRMPKEVLGDIAAQISSQELAAAKLSEFMDSYKLDTLDPLAKIIMDKSETALREAIRKLPDGEYKSDLYLDGHIDPLKISVTATIAGDEIRVDYSGTSPMIKNRGINVPMNYTHAYTTYAVSMLVNPDIPSNDGSFRPLKVNAPLGTVVNAPPPAPVQARHIIGHQCVLAVISAFEAAIPQRTIGDSGGVWLPQWYGKTDSGETFIINYFSNGGMGARATKDGISAFSFPTNVKNSPVEVFENLSPLVFEEKTLIQDSGGPGTMRGGLGQRISVRYTGKEPILISNLIERTIFPCKGRQNGGDGATGKISVRQSKGETLTPARNSKTEVPPDTSFIMELPGGGGFGPSTNRDPEAVLKDVVQEYISAEKASEVYKVAVIKDGSSLKIDWDKTNALRA